MNRIIEERWIGTHQVAIVEELMDEGVGYALMVGQVLLAEDEPLDHLPSDEEIREILHAHGLG